MTRNFAIAILSTVLVAMPSLASAKIFYSKESAIRYAFPDATKVEERSVYLNEGDAAWIRGAAGVEWPSRVARVYVAYKNDKPMAYGFIDTHRVRSLNQTVMVIVSSSGSISKSFVLAFHEPEEYGAPARWWEQFNGHRLDKGLSLRGGIDGISGATMTARAGVAVARRVLALYERKIAEPAVAKNH